MVRVGGLGYTIDVGGADGQPHLRPAPPAAPASRSRPGKDYIVAGWASVNEGTEGPPIWDVVFEHLAKNKVVAPREAGHVKVVGG